MPARLLLLLPWLLLLLPSPLTALVITINDLSEPVFREAIERVNTSGDAENRIRFTVPGRLELAAPLPTLERGVSIEAAGGTLQLSTAPSFSETLLLPVADGVVVSFSEGVDVELGHSGSAIRSSGDLSIGGDFAGAVSVVSTAQYNYGIRADGSLSFEGDLLGTVVVESDSRYAQALRSSSKLWVAGELGGSLTAVAGTYAAAGVRSESGMEVGGALSAAILARAQASDAYGLDLDGSLRVLGPISGSLIAEVLGGDEAAAIKADGGIYLPGGVTGELTAMVTGSDAAGLWSTGGGINGGAASSPLIIAGRVIAEAPGGAAAAVLAWKAMNLTVTGELRATGSSAYAIRSGSFSGSGGFVENPEGQDDRIELADGAVIVGGIDLGAGDDILTLSGTPVLDGLTELSGGEGFDTLLLNGWTGEVPSVATGWEQVGTSVGSLIFPAADGVFEGSMVVAGEAVLVVPALAGGARITGALVADGVVEMRDGSPSGTLVVDGCLSGVGSIGIDVVGGEADLISVGGDVEGALSLLLDPGVPASGAASMPAVLVARVEGSVAPDALQSESALDYGPYDVGLMASLLPGGGSEWYFGYRGLHSEALVAQSVEPLFRAALLSWRERFEVRRAYAGSAGGLSEEGGAWSHGATSGVAFSLEGGVEASVEGGVRSARMGYDLMTGREGNGTYACGLFLGGSRMDAEPHSSGGVAAGRIEGSGYEAGAYAAIGRLRRWHLEAQALASLQRVDLRFEDGDHAGFTLSGYALALGGGWHFPLRPWLAVAPRFGLSWVQVGRFSASAADIGRFEGGGEGGAVGELGLAVRVEPAGSGAWGSIEATLQGDFSPESAVRYRDADVELQAERPAGSVTLAAGIGNRASDPLDPLYWLSGQVAFNGGGAMATGIGVGLKVPL